ncbi:hypothetical protein KA344_21090 [bacterium]|jgi:hypothetical protein|nr:hypothetical protein [bacterium]
MTSHEPDEEALDRDRLVTRRTALKFVAGAPLVFTFSLVASPLARFLKPTMKPGGFFQAADMPAAEHRIEFNLSDFPTDWTCRPFEFRMKYVVFNPEQEEIRKIPGFAIRTAPDKIVAFSRICPGRSGILNFKTEMCCGCSESSVDTCNCAMKVSKPVLVCPNCRSVFDLAQDGRILLGSAPRPPRRFTVLRQGELITINELETWSIA